MVGQYTIWTLKQNKQVENSLDVYEKERPYRWEKVVASLVNEKFVEEMKAHYCIMVEYFESIDNCMVPIPKYKLLCSKLGNHKHA